MLIHCKAQVTVCSSVVQINMAHILIIPRNHVHAQIVCMKLVCVVMATPLPPQRPDASVQGLREYKRSRHGPSSSATIANTLFPQPISDLQLDDTIVQVHS